MKTSWVEKVQNSVLSCLKGASGRSISRILSSACAPGRPSIYAVYPGFKEASSLSSLLDLAPGGGYQAARIAANAGGLLHHLFTLTESRDSRVENSQGLLSHLYSPLSATCFLWPYPAGLPAPGFPRHRALWSADFPRPFA
jgi:hypothetical protein